MAEVSVDEAVAEVPRVDEARRVDEAVVVLEEEAVVVLEEEAVEVAGMCIRQTGWPTRL